MPPLGHSDKTIADQKIQVVALMEYYYNVCLILYNNLHIVLEDSCFRIKYHNINIEMPVKRTYINIYFAQNIVHSICIRSRQKKLF